MILAAWIAPQLSSPPLGIRHTPGQCSGRSGSIRVNDSSAANALPFTGNCRCRFGVFTVLPRVLAHYSGDCPALPTSSTCQPLSHSVAKTRRTPCPRGCRHGVLQVLPGSGSPRRMQCGDAPERKRRLRGARAGLRLRRGCHPAYRQHRSWPTEPGQGLRP